ncbi:MAG: AmmeMemoRadiSam system protein B, partial [Thermoplasmata archaeon]
MLFVVVKVQSLGSSIQVTLGNKITQITQRSWENNLVRHNTLLTVLVLLITMLGGGACTSPSSFSPTSAEPPTASPTSTPSPSPAGDHIRPPAVAGSWYPEDPALLQEMIDGMLAQVTPVDGAPIALIVPHAGYAYSGEVAATGFRQLENGTYEVAVIIASDHQPPLSNPISVWDAGGFETPLGIVPVDVELAQELIDADPHITADPAAHTDEHPIEIELPFLQRTCPHCRLVPVLMGNEKPEVIHALAQALLTVLPGRRAVVIASSDLSHYPSYEDARQVDGATLAAIETGDPDTVHTAIQGLMQSGWPNLVTCACGEAPIRVAMEVARGLGADTITVLRYANSGDTGGDREQVVGYGAVMFWHYEPPAFTPDQQEALLTLART